MMIEKMVVIVSGSLKRGYDICGPFQNEDEAHDFAQHRFSNRDCYEVIPIIDPKDA